MRFRLLGKTGLRVSALCLGTMNLGNQADEATSSGIVRTALDAGINFFDTADIYGRGETERVLGSALQSRRDKVIIASKVRGRMGDGPNDEGLSRAHIMKAVEGSLRRLGTDYIDIYYAHWQDPSTLLEETLRAFDDLIRQGKVRYIGLSNHLAWQTYKAVCLSERFGWARVAIVQPRYNLLDRTWEMDLFSLCREEGIGVAPYSPLAGGFLTGKYQPGVIPPGSRASVSDFYARGILTERSFWLLDKLQAAADEVNIPLNHLSLAWVLANDAVTSAVVGASSPEQLQEMVDASELDLSADVVQRLNDITGAR